jgi:hypothetical protein
MFLASRRKCLKSVELSGKKMSKMCCREACRKKTHRQSAMGLALISVYEERHRSNRREIDPDTGDRP